MKNICKYLTDIKLNEENLYAGILRKPSHDTETLPAPLPKPEDFLSKQNN